MAINDSKTTKTGNRDTNQHRNYIKDLINLLFYLDSEEFTLIITAKLYPKYQFQPYQAGRKLGSKIHNRAQNSINRFPSPSEASESLYEHHTHLKISTKGYCVFCTKKERKPSKKRDLGPGDFFISEFRFNSNQNIEIKRPKKQKKRGKQTIWYYEECQKHVYKKGNC